MCFTTRGLAANLGIATSTLLTDLPHYYIHDCDLGFILKKSIFYPPHVLRHDEKENP